MRRFYFDQEKVAIGQEVSLRGDLLHHMRDVCRFKLGSRFELLSTDGYAYFSEISYDEKRELKAKILSSRKLPELARPWIQLCLSMPKFQTFETVLEKSVELGVYRVQPFFSDFSFIKSSDKISESKKHRWQKIIVGATQQSGRAGLLGLEDPLQLEPLLNNFNQTPRALGLFAFEGSCSTTLHQALQLAKQNTYDEVWLFVGSEGGFSEREVAIFQQAGLQPLTLGEQVLRVETACLALASIIKYELGGLD